MWSVECKVWSVKRKLRSVSVECGVRNFPHRHGDATGKPETRTETRGRRENEHFVRDFLQFGYFQDIIKQVGMS